MKKVKEFLKSEQFKELIKYLFFGVLTTIVSLLSFKIFDSVLGQKLYLVSNIFSWILAVAFAFITNKIWVFRSKSVKKSVIFRELFSFVTARILSLLIEEGGLWLLVDILNLGKMQPFKVLSFSINGNFIAKLIMQIVVVILNYVFSKFIIFKNRGEASDEK